jgi:hypothetical protein
MGFLSNVKEGMRVQEESKKFSSGKYIAGHPTITSPIEVTTYRIEEPNLSIYPLVPARGNTATHLGEVAGTIPIADIANVTVEDASTASKRVTATRLLTVGVFAFAAKKKEVHAKFYVTITWGQGKIPNETMFEFEGKESQSAANSFKDAVVKAVNA